MLVRRRIHADRNRGPQRLRRWTGWVCLVLAGLLFGATRPGPAPADEAEPGDAQTAPEPSEQEKEEEARRRRRQARLKTVYDDRAVGEDQTAYIEAELGLYQDEALERYVRSVAIRLLRHAPPRPFDYEFKIVDQVVPNAFALPGGKIYLSRGLLALVDTEDELAAVIGHEITHAAERHAAARIEQSRRINPLTMGLMRAATIAAYGREQERDADRGGQILCAKAGYDPNGIATFLRKLDASERYEVGWSRLPFFLATHPTSPERSALASQRAGTLEWERARPVAGEGPDAYQNAIDGLVIGADPAGGVFQGNTFVHPDLGFSLRFPPGWATLNAPTAVSAVSPARDAEASLVLAGEAGDLEKVVDEFLDEEFDGKKLRVRDRREFKIGELPAIRVIGRASGLHLEMAFVELGDLAFRLTLISRAGVASRYRGRANAFVRSFRPLDTEGSYSLEVTRLRVAYALENETLAQLSARTHNSLELVYTGVLNDLFATTRLAKGQPVKIGLNEPYLPKPREGTRQDPVGFEAEPPGGPGSPLGPRPGWPTIR